MLRPLLKRLWPAPQEDAQNPIPEQNDFSYTVDDKDDDGVIIHTRKKTLTVEPEDKESEILAEAEAPPPSTVTLPRSVSPVSTPTLEPERTVLMPTPPPLSYGYGYTTGVIEGTLWNIIANVCNAPFCVNFSGTCLSSIIFVNFYEELLKCNGWSQADLIHEQFRKKMFLNMFGAALATNSLEYLFGDTLGFWAAPLIMTGTKVLASSVEKQLLQVPPFARNLASWWNRRPTNSADSKKSDAETIDTPLSPQPMSKLSPY